ncbi:MAG: AarF/ABC1/UbiB kinase family protein [Actinobacteria bacterium]|nr:AarF/ABC1/UbiB kinase family protein [Actinomycetota bacterium]
MTTRFARTRRALVIGRTAQRSKIHRVLAEVGVTNGRVPTREGARAFRAALEQLGPTFIKLGQLLSSRPDLLPDVYVEELSALVDSVPPVPFAEIEQVIAADLDEDAFVWIDPVPLATASIAQTHRALTVTGREVVVKVRRPGIVDQIELDLGVLRAGARLVAGHSETARLLQLETLVDELEVHLRAEMDFLEEANNTELIAEVLEGYQRLTVPEVIRPCVSERILVLEWIDGERVAASSAIDPALGQELAQEFFKAYVHQVVVEGLFHADPHSGNVLLTPDGRLALLDFGLLGRLDDDTRQGLSLLLLAIAQNRADDVAELVMSLSLVGVDADRALFVQEVRRILPRVHWRRLSGISAGRSLAELQQLAVRHRIVLPTTFALVGKTLAQADSIARTLDPELDPFGLVERGSLDVMLAEAERYLEPSRLLAFLSTQLHPLGRLPQRLGQVVTQLEQGSLKVAIAPAGLEEVEGHLRSIANRMGASIIIGSLLLSSALLARVDRFEWEAIAGFAVAGVLGLYMIVKIIRTPGEL